PLLACKPRDDADQGSVHGFGGQVEGFDESLFADSLARQVVFGVMGGKQRVDIGTPLAVIDAVENAGKRSGAGAQGAVQTEAVFGGLDLPGVRRADGAQGVGKRNTALDVADAAEELQAVGTVEGGVERSVGERRFWEQPLVPEIVDGEQGP